MVEAPDVSVNRIRDDFEAIWLMNVQTVVRIRKSETEAGNYGHVGEVSDDSRTNVVLNIQGITSDSYAREEYGLDTAGSTFHCYAKYDTDLVGTDRIEMAGAIYVISNLNRSYKDGQVGFYEFDLLSESLT